MFGFDFTALLHVLHFGLLSFEDGQQREGGPVHVKVERGGCARVNEVAVSGRAAGACATQLSRGQPGAYVRLMCSPNADLAILLTLRRNDPGIPLLRRSEVRERVKCLLNGAV